jgi:hypothetical protein
MDQQLTGHLTWSTDPTVPGWRLTIEEGPGRPATLLSLGAHVAQDASQQEVQTLLADAFHQYTGAIPDRIDLLIPVDTGHGGTAYRFCVRY